MFWGASGINCNFSQPTVRVVGATLATQLNVSLKEFEMIHYVCPECEDEGELPDDSPVKYCGICAGDVGRDVVLRLTFNAANQSMHPSSGWCHRYILMLIRIKRFLLWVVKRLDPIILWCFGWRRKWRVVNRGTVSVYRYPVWEDPKNPGSYHAESMAIQICEGRI